MRVKGQRLPMRPRSTKGKIPLGMERAYKQDLSELAEVEASQNEGHSLEREPILSETAATAGRTVTFNGLIGSSAYPYTDKEPSSNAPPSNMIEDPEIYIRLPEKITVENSNLYYRGTPQTVQPGRKYGG